jgi:hypothetical protein
MFPPVLSTDFVMLQAETRNDSPVTVRYKVVISSTLESFPNLAFLQKEDMMDTSPKVANQPQTRRKEIELSMWWPVQPDAGGGGWHVELPEAIWLEFNGFSHSHASLGI